MKTPEEIKKALAMCEDLIAGCKDCPYGEVDCRCMKSKDIDALEYIEQLEERIAIMEEIGVRRSTAILREIRREDGYGYR